MVRRHLHLGSWAAAVANEAADACPRQGSPESVADLTVVCESRVRALREHTAIRRRRSSWDSGSRIEQGRQLLLATCAEGPQTSGISSPAAGSPLYYWESGRLSFGNAPRSANAHTEPSSSSVGNSSGGVSEASFDEARRRFRPGILMLVLPGRLAQHDKDIGGARRAEGLSLPHCGEGG